MGLDDHACHALLSHVVVDVLLANAHHRAPFHGPGPCPDLAPCYVHDAGYGYVPAGRRVLGQIDRQFAPPLLQVHAPVLQAVWGGTRSSCLDAILAGCKHPSTDRHMAGALDATVLHYGPDPCRKRRTPRMGSSRRRHPRPGRAHEPATQVRSVRVRNVAFSYTCVFNPCERVELRGRTCP